MKHAGTRWRSCAPLGRGTFGRRVRWVRLSRRSRLPAGYLHAAPPGGLAKASESVWSVSLNTKQPTLATMDPQDDALVLRVLQAIEGDWAFTDQSDDDCHLILVSESRAERNDLKPSKALVRMLEDERLIELDHERSSSRSSKREFLEFFGKRIPVPFVHLYRITDEGRRFIAEHNVRQFGSRS